MAAAWGQSFLRLHISNRAWNTTLKYRGPSKNAGCDLYESSGPRCALPPGCSDSAAFLSRSNTLGRGWLVIYEAESFTLAIFFFLRRRPEPPRKVLRPEVSLDKAHLGGFRDTFERAAAPQDPPEPDGTVVSRAEFPGGGEASVGLLAGPCKVTASVSHGLLPDLKVLLEGRVVRR